MTSQNADMDSIVRRLDSVAVEIQELRQIISRTTRLETNSYPHIESKPGILSGEPIIKGTRTPVRAIVEHWKFGSSPEEIRQKLPYLRLAQIFDALSYYDDHREEIEHYIELNRIPVDD